MPSPTASDLTAAEVVSLVSPVAGRLGIEIRVSYGNQHDWNEYVEITHGPLERERISNPANAARLIVGMIAEKSHSYFAGLQTVGALVTKDAGEHYSGPRTLRSILAASCAAFARATEGGSDGK